MAGLEIKHFDSPEETLQIDCRRPFFGSRRWVAVAFWRKGDSRARVVTRDRPCPLVGRYPP